MKTLKLVKEEDELVRTTRGEDRENGRPSRVIIKLKRYGVIGYLEPAKQTRKATTKKIVSKKASKKRMRLLTLDPAKDNEDTFSDV